MSETIHATTVAINGRAVLLEGRSGTGKSDLALRLIDRGAVLVSDDYTVLTALEDTLMASAPTTIAGLMEVRGIGILPFDYIDRARVALLVQLDGAVERLPEITSRWFEAVPIPAITLDPLAASAPIKVELALRHLLESIA